MSDSENRARTVDDPGLPAVTPDPPAPPGAPELDLDVPTPSDPDDGDPPDPARGPDPGGERDVEGHPVPEPLEPPA